WTQITANVCTDLEYRPGSTTVFYGAFTNGKYILTFTKSGSWGWSTYTLPASNSYRTELAVAANNANVVYAITVNSSRGLEGIYKSINAGVSYSLVFDGSIAGNNMLGYNCDGSDFGGQGTYDIFITANPLNANEVYVGGINVWKSTDGGNNWTANSHWSGTCSGTVTTVHADQHCCEFQPGTNDVFIGNDGGIYKSTNAGSSWNDITNGLTINQIYRIGVSQSSSSDMITGLQDNGTHVHGGSGWFADGVIGGDGMECLIDPSDFSIQFGEYTNGDISRTTNHWTSQTNVRNLIRTAAGDPNLEGAWVTPYMLDPNDPNTLFVAYDNIWKSTDQGATSGNFSKISNFATAGTIRSLQIAPSNSNYIYAGFLNVLYKSTDGGSNWTVITSGLPVSNGNITYITVKNDDPNTVWVTIGGFNSDAVYETTNGGSTWTNISTGLPQIPAMSVVQNIKNTNKVELYVTMMQGVYMKTGTANWVPFSSGLPNVFCTELEIYYDDNIPSNSKIRTGTFGRGLWETDLPDVDFSASNKLPLNAMTTVSFTDLSTNSPSGWYWSFNPGTVTFVGGTNANSQNPMVQFNNPGEYAVTLTTTNTYGNDAESKSAYIHMGTPGLWTGASGTDWNTKTNWHNHLIPDASVGVSINPGAVNWPVVSGDLDIGTDCGTLSMSANSEITVTGDLTIPSGKTLYCAANAVIDVEGDFINYGTFTPGNSIVKMTGSSDASISGNIPNAGNQATIPFPGGGYPYPGAYFDVIASGGKNISVNSFDFHCNSTGAINVEVWYKSGTYQGFTSNPGAWTQLGTTQTVTGQGSWSPTSVNPGASIIIPSGATYGFYINCYSGSSVNMWLQSGSNSFANSEITFNTGGMAQNVGVGTGAWNGYTFHGTVYYSYVASNPIAFFDLEIDKMNALVSTDGNLNVSNDLYVSSGTDFTNADGNTINVTGNMLLKADATGMASFLDNGTTSSGSTTVQQYLTSERWHFVTPPVAGATINSYLDIYLKEYDETSDAWNYLVDPLNSPMGLGKGYSAWADDDLTGPTVVEFDGPLTNTDLILSGFSYSPATNSTYYGFHLVGNPFPCAIDWNSNWSMSNMSGWMVIYDNGTSKGIHTDGTPWNGLTSSLIQSTQGFWVRATNTSGSITIPASQRQHSNQAFYKETREIEYPYVRLHAQINGLDDEALVIFHPECTAGFDGYYDLGKFDNVNEAPTLFTYADDGNPYAVNYLEPDYTDRIVPVGFRTGSEGTYHITASDIHYFDANTHVYLEDLLTGQFVDLLFEPEYEFSYDPSDDDHRFNLFITASPLATEQTDAVGVDIWSHDRKVFVACGVIDDAQISVYNTMGQEIFQTNTLGAKYFTFELCSETGVYIVEVSGGGYLFTEKVFVK
ncbi:MAG: PKD domain-containing protein, partial [Bacteroidales bacterium]|nr:PKD domain-containing protein [Bacteroidales bacterium]